MSKVYPKGNQKGMEKKRDVGLWFPFPLYKNQGSETTSLTANQEW